MKRKEHNFDVNFLNKVAKTSSHLALFKNIFVNKWNAMDKFGNTYTCDEIMSLEHSDSNFDVNGINLNFLKILDKMKAYRPVVYSGDKDSPVHSPHTAGLNKTVNVINTGTGDLHLGTQIAVIPPICQAPRYSRLSSNNSNDEVFVLQTVSRVKIVEHLGALMRVVHCIRQMFDVTDVDVSGGYKKKNGHVAGHTSNGLTGVSLTRAKIEFRASIESIIRKELQLNPLWMDLSACILSVTVRGGGTMANQKNIANYDLFRAVLDASSAWFSSGETDEQDVMAGMIKVIKDKPEPNPAEMTSFLMNVAQDTNAPTDMASAQQQKQEFKRSKNYIRQLMEHMKNAYGYMTLIAQFIRVFDLPKTGQVMEGQSRTFFQNQTFCTTLCADA
jgi:hypothetical protein